MIVEPFANDKLEDNLNPIGRVFYSNNETESGQEHHVLLWPCSWWRSRSRSGPRGATPGRWVAVYAWSLAALILAGWVGEYVADAVNGSWSTAVHAAPAADRRGFVLGNRGAGHATGAVVELPTSGG